MACQNSKITDYSKKTLYIQLVEFSYSDCKSNIYGYNLDDNGWSVHNGLIPLIARTGNLLKSCWSDNNCIIVENYLYKWQIFEYPDGRLAILIIRDLENEMEVHNNTIE